MMSYTVVQAAIQDMAHGASFPDFPALLLAALKRCFEDATNHRS
jgi:hypothetical protein